MSTVKLSDLISRPETNIFAILGDYITVLDKHYVVLSAGGYDDMQLQEVSEITETNAFMSDEN